MDDNGGNRDQGSKQRASLPPTIMEVEFTPVWSRNIVFQGPWSTSSRHGNALTVLNVH